MYACMRVCMYVCNLSDWINVYGYEDECIYGNMLIRMYVCLLYKLCSIPDYPYWLFFSHNNIYTYSLCIRFYIHIHRSKALAISKSTTLAQSTLKGQDGIYNRTIYMHIHTITIHIWPLLLYEWTQVHILLTIYISMYVYTFLMVLVSLLYNR